MNIEAHIDVANQIDNYWNKDTALAIKIENLGFSIKIRAKYKKRIKNKFITKNSSQKNNRRVAVILHSYLIYRLLDKYQKFCSSVRVCCDIGNFINVQDYYQKICNKHFSKNINVKLKSKKGKKKSPAHRLANDVYNRKVPEDILIKDRDMGNIIDIIRRLL